MKRVIIKEIALRTKKEVIRVCGVIIVNNLGTLQTPVIMNDKNDNMVIIITIKLDVIIAKDLDILLEIVMMKEEIIKIKAIRILSVMSVDKRVITQEIVNKDNDNYIFQNIEI